MKKAQEAYEEVMSKMKDIDITAALEKAEEAIESAIEKKQLCCVVGQFPLLIAEKAAIELEKFGYNVATQHSGKYFEDMSPIISVTLNFKYLPASAREVYN